MSDGRPAGDPDVDRMLASIERAAIIDAEMNYRVGDNHLLLADRLVANVAALKNLNDNRLLEAVLAANPPS